MSVMVVIFILIEIKNFFKQKWIIEIYKYKEGKDKNVLTSVVEKIKYWPCDNVIWIRWNWKNMFGWLSVIERRLTMYVIFVRKSGVRDREKSFVSGGEKKEKVGKVGEVGRKTKWEILKV